MHAYDYIPQDATKDQTLAADIIQLALEAPLKQIFVNAGVSMDDINMRIENNDLPLGFGYNVKTGEYGDLVKMGVIDPLKVTRCALQNAVSVATTILSTNAIITMARSYGAA
jgi:chaperonin GroEL